MGILSYTGIYIAQRGVNHFDQTYYPSPMDNQVEQGPHGLPFDEGSNSTMISVNTHEAKSKLSQLLAAAEEKGEVVLICRNGKTAAELKAPAKSPKNRLEPGPSLRV